jgi:hypothetical protein
MKRWLIVPILAAAMALVPVSAAADDEEGNHDGNHEGGNHGNTFGPFDSASGDSGTCGPDWALDTFKRVFRVEPNSDGTFKVREDFNDGHFVTTGPASPGACETKGPHGLLVKAGVKGNFGGFESGTVTGATQFTPESCEAASNPCGGQFSSNFIHTVFGPGATFSVTSFRFAYHAEDQGLIFRRWINASDDLGGNKGDIATA